MHLYAGKEELNHYQYYNREGVQKLSQGLFNLEAARPFLFGLNQVFSLIKI